MRNDLKLLPWEICSEAAGWNDDFLESVFFLGNGRMGVRGYLPFEPDSRPTQQGLFLAGIFGEIKDGITDFVNLLQFVIDLCSDKCDFCSFFCTMTIIIIYTA